VGIVSVPDAAAGTSVVAVAAAALAHPGLVVLTGTPGSGRSTTLQHIGEAFRGPVFAGGGLAMLQAVAAFALSRAVRVRLPVHDTALLAEAVRSRVRGGLLLLDDLQWADPLTIAALPLIAAHCRIAVTVRRPHRMPADVERTLHDAATAWLAVPPMTSDAATALASTIAPAASAADIAAAVTRAGGIPLAVTALARALNRPPGGRGPTPGAAAPGGPPPADPAGRDASAAHSGASAATAAAYPVAVALADLTRPPAPPAPSGLLGRPADPRHARRRRRRTADAGLITVDAAAAPSARGRPTPPMSPPVCWTPPNAAPCTDAWPTWSRPAKPPATWPPPAPVPRPTTRPSPRRPPPR
jgi:hypothetical protein